MKEINLITHEELKDIETVEKLCGKLHLMSPPRTTVMAEITGVDGNVKLKQTMLSKSWVRNAYCICECQLGGIGTTGGGTTYGAGALALKNTVGTTRSGDDTPSASGTGSIKNYLGAAGVETQGIVIGTGDTAESFEHYQLNTQIAHGTSAGQMQYLAQSPALFIYDSVSKKYTVRHVRGFTNNSGSSITVKEVGWYVKLNSPNLTSYMFCRDLFSPTIPVANGETLTITYEISLVFPE